jgi:hypothetical protein
MTGRAHVVIVVVTLLAIVFVVRLLRQGVLRTRFAMLWTLVGGGLVVLAAFPRLLDWTAERLGFFYPPAVFALASTAFLMVLSVQFSWEISRLEERTRVLAEEIALLRNERDADAEISGTNDPT